MARPATTFLDVLDARTLVKSSRLRIGSVQTKGVPAILFGVAAVVFAAGAGEALKRAAVALPDTLRETRNLIVLARSTRELPSTN
jgi:hypothetical protein